MTITMLTTAPRLRWGALGASLLAGLSLTSCGLANPQSTVDEEQTISMIVTESAPFQEPTEIVKDQLEEGVDAEYHLCHRHRVAE